MKIDIDLLVTNIKNAAECKKIEIRNKIEKSIEGQAGPYLDTYAHGYDRGYLSLAEDLLKWIEIENELNSSLD